MWCESIPPSILQWYPYHPPVPVDAIVFARSRLISTVRQLRFLCEALPSRITPSSAPAPLPSTYCTPSLSYRALAGPAKLRTRTTSSPRRFSLSSLLSSAPPAAPPTARSTYTGSAPAAIWLDWIAPRAAGQGGHPDDTKRVSWLLWVSLRVMRARYGMDRLDECYCMHGGAMREVGELEEGCLRQSAI